MTHIVIWAEINN